MTTQNISPLTVINHIVLNKSIRIKNLKNNINHEGFFLVTLIIKIVKAIQKTTAPITIPAMAPPLNPLSSPDGVGVGVAVMLQVVFVM